jgi:hypothetical protein
VTKIVKIPKLRFAYSGGDSPEAKAESERRVKMAYNRIFSLAYRKPLTTSHLLHKLI